MITQELLNSLMRNPGETNRREPPKLPECPNCGERYCGDGVQLCVECEVSKPGRTSGIGQEEKDGLEGLRGPPQYTMSTTSNGVLEHYDQWIRGLCEPPSLEQMAHEIRRLRGALDDLEVHATREIVPNLVGVPVVEWDAVFRLLSLHGKRGP